MTLARSPDAGGPPAPSDEEEDGPCLADTPEHGHKHRPDI